MFILRLLDIKNDPDGVDDFRTFWKYCLNQGASVGCYKLDSEGQIGELVGANMLFVNTEETTKDFNKLAVEMSITQLCKKCKKTYKRFLLLQKTIKSRNFKKIWDLFGKLGHEVDAFKIYNADKYISSISLSVSPTYRGQKLGYHILRARLFL